MKKPQHSSFFSISISDTHQIEKDTGNQSGVFFVRIHSAASADKASASVVSYFSRITLCKESRI